MTYIHPQNTAIPTIGIDGTITSLQAAIGQISWLDKCFHRAYRHYEQGTFNNGELTIPKTWEANAEWYNCLPNDNLISQAFFYPLNDEDVIESEPHVAPLWESDICLIVWVNTTKISGHTTGPSLANEKADVLAVLTASDLVTGIDSIVDKSAPDIFDPFTIDDPRNHFTMLPFAGFRVNFRVKYDYIVCQPASS